MQKIPIVLSSDDNYAPFVSTTCMSILENTVSQIHAFVFDFGITQKNVDRIKKDLCKYENLLLEFVKIPPEVFVNYPKENSYVSKAAYSRLLIPEIIKQYDKIIYSDIDVIFMGDVKILYEEDLSGHIIGAVPDAIYKLNKNLNYFQNRLDIQKNHEYFYSGLLLINAKSWNEHSMSLRLNDVVVNYSYRLLQGDQDILNKLFENNNYKKLSVKYCATNGYINKQEYFERAVISDLNNIIIRHFEGAKKPWNSTNKIKNKNIYWNYIRKSLFYDEQLLLYRKICAKEYMLKFLKFILKFLPYFLVNKKISKINNKLKG